MKPKTSLELGEISRKYSHMIVEEGLAPAEELIVANAIHECLFAVHISKAMDGLQNIERRIL